MHNTVGSLPLAKNALHSPTSIILDECISLFGERERPEIQPPVAAVVWLDAVEDESLSPRKFPWKLALTGDV